MTDSNFLMDQVAGPLRNFLEKQRATLRLADFVDVAALDDEKTQLREFVATRYPHMDADVAAAIAGFFGELVSGGLHENIKLLEENLDVFIDVAGPDMEDPYTFATMIHDAVERQRRLPSAPAFYSSLLANLVAAFEVFMGDMARAILRLHPKILDSKTRTFSWQSILEAGSLEDLREAVLEDYVGELMRGSMADLIGEFRAKLHVEIPEYVTPDALAEVFLRRNIWIHNDGRVSAQYLKRLPATCKRPEIGETMSLDREYLAGAADGLVSLAFFVTWAMGCKFKKCADWSAFEGYMVNFPYRLLQDERYTVVKNATTPEIREKVVNESNQRVMQVNHWLALKRLGQFDQCRQAVHDWQTASLAKNLQLARLALLDEMEPALELVERIRGTDDLPLVNWQTWPLLAELRAYERELRAASET